MVVDSTDRKRISVVKHELMKLLAHEVSAPALDLTFDCRIHATINVPLLTGANIYAFRSHFGCLCCY